jgi:hypothetical protein
MEQTQEDALSSLSVKDLKSLLHRHKIDFRGALEKSELLKLAREHNLKWGNRLANEKSPYLLQHKNNPVDWYPFGEEAFEKAKKEDKCLIISIGYGQLANKTISLSEIFFFSHSPLVATCHWCHVMERECFENEEIASLMNESFVCVKVDREELPGFFPFCFC